MDNKPKRRRFRFSLRMLLVFVTIACVGFGWLGVKVRAKEKERELVRAIRQAGESFGTTMNAIHNGIHKVAHWSRLVPHCYDDFLEMISWR